MNTSKIGLFSSAFMSAKETKGEGESSKHIIDLESNIVRKRVTSANSKVRPKNIDTKDAINLVKRVFINKVLEINEYKVQFCLAR